MDNLGDIAALLGPILSDPSAMESLYETAESLGLGSILKQAQSGGGSTTQQNAAEPQQTADEARQKPPSGTDSSDILSSVLRIAPLLSSINKEDDSTRLLSALRPFLSEDRARRIDEAEKMMTLLRVVTLLREANLPGGII